MGALLGDEPDGLLAVGRGGDDLDLGERAEQDHESLTHAGLVVGDDDAQRHGHVGMSGHRGTFAMTTQSLPFCPALSVPLTRRSRSRIPASPYPPLTVASSGP